MCRASHQTLQRQLQSHLPRLRVVALLPLLSPSPMSVPRLPVAQPRVHLLHTAPVRSRMPLRAQRYQLRPLALLRVNFKPVRMSSRPPVQLPVPLEPLVVPYPEPRQAHSIYLPVLRQPPQSLEEQ